MEVTVNWKVLDFDNKDEFYTDSNALEMQHRVLDQRPDYKVSTHMPVSSNYYPVNSAIVMRDSKRNLQVTVSNDRSQGGSVLKKGRIEFMQHRRLYYDDYRGVGEALNEIDAKTGKPILVTANYHLQIFDMSKEKSYQRTRQLLTDEPLLQYFSYDRKMPESF